MQSILRHDEAPSSATLPVAQQWLVAAACQPAACTATDIPEAAAPGWAQLSGRQKGDLACLALASLATLGLIFLPLLEDHQRPQLASTVVVAPIMGAPQLVAAVPPSTAAEWRGPRPRRRAPGWRAEVMAVGSIATPHAQVPGTLDLHIVTGVSVGAGYVAVNAQRRGTLARLLVGSGRHKVQPFPLPSE